MRVLWVDADDNPWTEANGWKVLEHSGVDVRRVTSISDAYDALPLKDFDLLVVRAELPDVVPFLVAARQQIIEDGQKMVLTSSEWTKDQFRAHAKTNGAAHRYARIPMPPAGLLKLFCEIFGIRESELKKFSTRPVTPPELPKKAKRKAAASAESEDVDVLRKYLRIKEEQLEISEGEREELSRENERVRKEAHALQAKLREFEHLHDELSKKVAAMEEARGQAERRMAEEKEDLDRSAKQQAERVKALENQLSEAGEKYENLRVRVRKDIRKIRENERELEARLELTRKDSATLLQARDEKVLELQRKIDALEFDLDQIQDGRVQAQMEAERYLAKLSRVARALHIANSMIEEDHANEEELEELEPVYGGAANAEEPAPEVEAAAEAPAPAGAETPPVDPAADPAAALDEEALKALASEGDPTRMVSTEGLENQGGEPESSSG